MDCSHRLGDDSRCDISADDDVLLGAKSYPEEQFDFLAHANLPP